jgi:hypothetical protein
MISLKPRLLAHARWVTNRHCVTPGLLLVAILLSIGPAARADQFYWTGNSAGGPIWNSTIGGTNWSIDPNTLADPAAFPTNVSDVFFVFPPENNPTTTLGADFSIKGLFFTTDAILPVTIGIILVIREYKQLNKRPFPCNTRRVRLQSLFGMFSLCWGGEEAQRRSPHDGAPHRPFGPRVISLRT